MSDLLLLGNAPRPNDGALLAKRIRKLMIAAEPANIECTARINAELDGPDIARLDLNLTGYVMGNKFDHDRNHIAPQGAPVTVEDGVVRDLRVHAAPMRYSDADVTVDAALQDVPLRWIETDAGELALEPGEPSETQPMHGHARVSIPENQLGDAARGFAGPALQAMGVTLASAEVNVAVVAPRTIRVQADLRVRKAMLSAPVRAEFTVAVDDTFGVTFSDVTVHSRNGIVNAMLSMVRGKIAGFEGRRLDVTDRLPRGIRIEDLHVSVEDGAVVIETRLA